MPPCRRATALGILRPCSPLTALLSVSRSERWAEICSGLRLVWVRLRRGTWYMVTWCLFGTGSSWSSPTTCADSCLPLSSSPLRLVVDDLMCLLPSFRAACGRTCHTPLFMMYATFCRCRQPVATYQIVFSCLRLCSPDGILHVSSLPPLLHG